MTAQPHLTRRGDVYYWRRKTRRLSTEIIDLQLSLRTTDRAEAAKLARRLSAESDTILDLVEKWGLTPEEARSYLRHVIETEAARLARTRTVLNTDVGPHPHGPEEQYDWAHRYSWKLLSDKGVGIELTPELIQSLRDKGYDELHIDALERALPMLRDHMRSEPRALQRARTFETLTGRYPSSSIERSQLMQLEIDGKNAAHQSTLARIGQDIAAKVAAEVEAAILAGRLSDDGASVIAASANDLVETPIDMPNRDQAETSLDPSIAATLERMLDLKKSDDVGLEEKTANQYRACIALFSKATGKTDIRSIRQADLVRFREVLTKLPKSYGKRKTDRQTPIEEILDRAKTLPADQVGLAVGTLNRYIEQMATLIAAGRAEKVGVDVDLDPLALRRRQNRRKVDSKRSFKTAELRRLFAHPFWTASPHGSGTRRRAAPPRNGNFWVPLICAYSGMRRNEIAGFGVKEFRKEDDIWYFDIVETPERRFKTLSSARRIPVHPDLISLGILEFVKHARERKQVLLFPELKEAGSEIYGRKVTRHLDKVIAEIWGEDTGLSLNSMRHHAHQCWKLDKEVKEAVARELMGHEGKDTHESVYGERCPIKDLAAAVNRLPSVIDLVSAR